MSLIWPAPTKDPSQYRRIDAGWDLQFKVGTPILAVAAGTISYAHDPHGFGDPYPVLHLDTPIDGNPAIYYGHEHPEVPVGVHVAQGAILCHAAQVPGGNAHNMPGWLEIGWWGKSGPTGNGKSMHDHLVNAPVIGGGHVLNAPVVGGCATPSGGGYWLVASDGGIFSHGDAQFFGSMGGQHLNSPIAGMACTKTGKGYWLVASDGGVFTFGDAKFEGSLGGTHLNAGIVGILPTPTNLGYWLIAADGGVFAEGDAVFHGADA